MSEAVPSQLEDLRQRLRAFARARDWEQFHTPRNLATALTVEAAELLEPFRWAKGHELTDLSEDARQLLAREAADVLICLVQFADKLDIDLYQAALDKIALNAENYPAEKVRGSARKYSDYER